MPDHNLELPGFLSEADKAWYELVRRAATIPGIQTQEYVQQTIQREANEEVPILPTQEQLDLMMAEMDINARRRMQVCLLIIEEMRAIENDTDTIIDSAIYDFMDNQVDDEQETGIQFSPSQVEDFLQTLGHVEISSLGTDDTMCSICKENYGEERGKATGPASDADQRLPGEETPEYPVELSCRHVFGDWCIKAWLLRQPASCPACRFQFRPVR